MIPHTTIIKPNPAYENNTPSNNIHKTPVKHIKSIKKTRVWRNKAGRAVFFYVMKSSSLDTGVEIKGCIL
jgi:hypothetical protein